MHKTYRYPEVPWVINLVEVDLTRSNIHVETVKAKERIMGLQRTSGMVIGISREDYWVAAGINGDFYKKGGLPINTQVLQGKILKKPNNHSVFGIYDDRRPFIEIPVYRGELLAGNGMTFSISGINQRRDKDDLALYNSFFGDSTETNRFGAEIGFSIVNKWAINDTFKIVVVSIDSSKGNRQIPGNGGVLSGHGKARRWLLDNMAIGDTVGVIIALTNSPKRIMQAIGGLPRIIRNGKVSIEEGGGGFAEIRHPRTGIGYSKDSRKLFLFSVDGRQPGYSAGMTLYEMADFLLGAGAFHAINLDGGGSTTMVVSHKVVNRPSDTAGERPVANAFVIVSTKPLNSDQ